MKSKIDVSPSVGSNLFSVFYDTCYPGVIRGSYLKVHNNFFKPINLFSLITNHLLQPYLKDISLGAVDIDCHSLYASSGPGYSYA